MPAELVVHSLGLVAVFAAVTTGTYGLLAIVRNLDLFPETTEDGRTRLQEAAHRLGAQAAHKGWFRTLRKTVQRDLVRARLVDIHVDDFIGKTLLNALIGFAGVWLLTIVTGGSPINIIPAAAAAFFLYQLPTMRLKSKAAHRINELTHRLPYALQLIVLSTEAGSGFEDGLAILVREDPNTPLHEEFEQVLRDMQLGKTRSEALRAMAERVQTDDIGALVTALDVAEDLGTPIADTLRKQAEAVRSSRITRAERIAREAGPKMALPNTLIMLANVLLILAPFLPKLALNF